MPIIGRNELIDEVSEKTGRTKKDVRAITDSLLNTIMMRLVHNDDTVAIHNFGRFSVAKLEARTGRDPRTGDTIDLPARRRIRFKASKPIRDELAAKS